MGIFNVLQMKQKKKKEQCGLAGYFEQCFNLKWKHYLWTGMFCMLQSWIRDVRRRFSLDSKGIASLF